MDENFDKALVASAFDLLDQVGWRGLSVAQAARAAGLPLDHARARFPFREAILLRFGVLADQVALKDAPSEGPSRDRLFDIVMRRIDALQVSRNGVLALLRTLPGEPALALMLTCASLRSMAWLLEGAGISATGPIGALRTKGMLAVWLWTIRAWQRDDSIDLSATMAALDVALNRAEQAAGWLPRSRREPISEKPPSEPSGMTEEVPQPPPFTPPEPPASPPI
jgi:AcrR family transcriptional regulator